MKLNKMAKLIFSCFKKRKNIFTKITWKSTPQLSLSTHQYLRSTCSLHSYGLPLTTNPSNYEPPGTGSNFCCEPKLVTHTTHNSANQFVEALIYDMHGTLLIEDGFQKQTSLSIGNLKPGVYMVVLRTAYHFEAKRLLVN